MLSRVGAGEDGRPVASRGATRPSGARIAGWVATLFCAFLAFINAGLASEIGFRVFFLACGSLLVLGVISMVSRWFREARAGDRMSPHPPA